MEGEPWFVAADVCKALSIANNRDALSRVDEDEKGVASTDTPGGEQQVAIINEPGLYSLVLGSRKPEARAFKRWITHEVVPTIRRHGAYMTQDVLERAISDPDDTTLICRTTMVTGKGQIYFINHFLAEEMQANV